MKKLVVRAWVAIGLSSVVAISSADAETRQQAIENHDYNADTRLDGKEMKDFKKDHPKMFDSLMAFCDDSKDDPRAMGVKLPDDPVRQQLHCKKKHVARGFLIAWSAKTPD